MWCFCCFWLCQVILLYVLYLRYVLFLSVGQLEQLRFHRRFVRRGCVYNYTITLCTFCNQHSKQENFASIINVQFRYLTKATTSHSRIHIQRTLPGQSRCIWSKPRKLLIGLNLYLLQSILGAREFCFLSLMYF